MLSRCQKVFENKKRCSKSALPGEKFCEKHRQTFRYQTYSIGHRQFAGQRTVGDYQTYIDSPEWKEKAKTVRDHFGNQCQLCHGKGMLHIHHNTYVRLGNERPEDLTVLCASCHELFHQFYEYDGAVGYFKPKLGLLKILRKLI